MRNDGNGQSHSGSRSGGRVGLEKYHARVVAKKARATTNQEVIMRKVGVISNCNGPNKELAQKIVSLSAKLRSGETQIDLEHGLILAEVVRRILLCGNVEKCVLGEYEKEALEELLRIVE